MLGKVILMMLVLLAGSIVCFSAYDRQILPIRKIRYPPEFLRCMERAYEVTGTIRGMLWVLEHDFEKESIHKHISKALAYLNESRYRDFETALEILSDESWKYMEVYRCIMEKEAMKSKRIEMKTNVPNFGTGKAEDEKK